MSIPCIQLQLIGRCFSTHVVCSKMMTSKSTENSYQNWTDLITITQVAFNVRSQHAKLCNHTFCLEFNNYKTQHGAIRSPSTDFVTCNIDFLPNIKWLASSQDTWWTMPVASWVIVVSAILVLSQSEAHSETDVAEWFTPVILVGMSN